MAISAGTYTVGGAATDYPGVTGLDDAIADTIGFTGALTYLVSGDVDWTTDISLTQNGYLLTITSDTWHEGKISQGWYVTMDNNKAIAPAGANKVLIEKLKIRTIGTKIISIGNAAQPYYEFDKCILHSITIQFARPSSANESKFTNNLFYESLIDILGSQAVDNYITIENNFFYATQKCVTFRVWNTQPDYTSTILRNNYFIREIGDDAIHHTGTILVYPSGYNNATKGTSVATFPWNISSDNKPSIDPADNIQSLNITSDLYGRLIDGQVAGAVYTPGAVDLGWTGIAPIYAGVTDAAGNTRPDSSGNYSIGAFSQQYLTCHENVDTHSKKSIREFHSKIEVTWTDSFIDNTTAATANDTNRIHDVTNLISQTMDGVTAVPRRWAHLDDTIVADGTFYPMPGTTLLAATNQVGWWGKEECNSDGEWIQSTTTTTTTMTPNQYPTLTTTFASRPIYSLLVCGDNIYGEYPRSFEIKVYTLSTDTVPVYTDSVTDDVGSGWTLSNVNAGDAQAVKWDKTLTTSIDSCQKIELIIKKWNVGLRVVKISEFYTAITETYTDDDILSMKLLEESEIADGSLPVGNVSSNELDIKLQNIENRFFWGNTDSPLHNLIKINRRIKAWIGIELADDSIYYVLLGTFFSGDWDAQELGTDVSTAARDRMELLRKADYETSPLNENITLYDLAVLVLDDAKTKITDLEYNISTDLQNYTLPYGWFEKQSYFKCLKQIAGACMGRAYMDRDDVLQIDTDL